MAPSRPNSIQSVTRLRWLLALLFLGLALPAGILIRQGFAQIEMQEFRRQQLIAEGLAGRIDAELAAAVAVENARPFSDYEFARLDAAVNGAQRSPLSSIMPANAFPGAIGYFQVDASGQLSTPLLPEPAEQDLDLEPVELESRRIAQLRVADVLEANRLVRAAASGEPGARVPQGQGQEVRERTAQRAAEPEIEAAAGGQAAFDELASRSLADAAEEVRPPASAADAPTAARPRRLGLVSVADLAGGDLEPLRFSLLETGHLVLFRNAWHEGQRFIQGVLVDAGAFVHETHRAAFEQADLAAGTRLAVTVAGTEIASLQNGSPLQARGADGAALYMTRLSPPLADTALSFSAGALPRGPGFGLLVWTTVVLFGVLLGGFALMYRFGAEQIRLAEQQQNFVSAVSHELKTPLTSIRMYGEMLQSGWASDEKKQTYYDFILAEGERLSRLIDNVLQLARLNRGGPAISMQRSTVADVCTNLTPMLTGQAERAGFTLGTEIAPEAAAASIDVDFDALTQVFINLVDNAIKFAHDAERKQIVVSARRLDRDQVTLTVRDFGPGIRQSDMKRLFELFYRPDNALTRTTAGTGIGLALVKQLVAAMGGNVDVRNTDPGAEFRVVLPITEPGQSSS